MHTNTMETHGDISGGWIGEDFPNGSHSEQPTIDTSGVSYGDRGADLGSKNAGIIQFLGLADMPAPRERLECLDLAKCYGACDGHVEVYEEDVQSLQEREQHSDVVVCMGQLALF